MEPGYIKIFCRTNSFLVNDKISYTIDEFHNYLTTIHHIHKLHVKYLNEEFPTYEKMFLNANHITIFKLVVDLYHCLDDTNIEKLVECFERIENICTYRKITPDQLPYPIKIYTDRGGEDKLVLINKSETKYIAQFYKIPKPNITHICINVSSICTNEMLSTILSHPFDRINIIFSSYYIKYSHPRHIDMTELVDALISNPARHI